MSVTPEDFMTALQEAERDHSSDRLVDLFSPHASCANLAHQAQGLDEVRDFWDAYLASFIDVASEFTHVIEHADGFLLEWVAHGVLANGEPIGYRGVSLIDVGPEGIESFRTYYDSAVFVPLAAR